MVMIYMWNWLFSYKTLLNKSDDLNAYYEKKMQDQLKPAFCFIDGK